MLVGSLDNQVMEVSKVLSRKINNGSTIVCIQAKHWENTVGRPVVQDFKTARTRVTPPFKGVDFPRLYAYPQREKLPTYNIVKEAVLIDKVMPSKKRT